MYTIGEVEEITGVKAHVLRYWEEVISGFAPQKNPGGRRRYNQRELELVMRLNYLITHRKFTIEGARNQIIADADAVNENAAVIKAIHDLRTELTELYFLIKKYAPTLKSR